MNSYIVYLNILVPVIIKAIIPDGRYGLVTIVTDLIVLPMLLLALNVYLLVKTIEISYLKCFSFMLLGLLLGNLAGYIIWGISSKKLFNPDGETIWIMKSLIIYHVSLVLIFYLLCQFGKFIKHFKK
jgi:hypothetical protein